MSLRSHLTATGAVAGFGLLGAGTAGTLGNAALAAVCALPALGGSCGLALVVSRREQRQAAADRAAMTTDNLTGLPNAARLRADLGTFLATAAPEDRRELFIFDLVGFKKYNDTFGFACGDALLRRIAGRLAGALGRPGTVYRLRGGQLALLAAGDTTLLRHLADDALFEIGEGFMVRCAEGSVSVPDEARGVSEALKLADQRVHARRSALRSQGIDELSIASPTPAPPPTGRVGGLEVGELAVTVGEALGLVGHELDHLETAVALRDVGMMALPEDLVGSARRLTDDEWHFVGLHTLAGERLLRANFEMDAVATLVRASHERWDGSGYPDRLAGEDIPLAARVLFACGALEDMRTERAHRPALTAEQALRELDRCAGTQFDPAVVGTLTGVLSDAPALPPDTVGTSWA